VRKETTGRFARPPLEFSMEKLREEELEEACAIQSVMLPGQAEGSAPT